MSIYRDQGSSVSPSAFQETLHIIGEQAQNREAVLVRMAANRAVARAMMYGHNGLGINHEATRPIDLSGTDLITRLFKGVHRAVRHESQPVEIPAAGADLEAPRMVLRHTVSTYTPALLPGAGRQYEPIIEQDDYVIARQGESRDGPHDVGLFSADFPRATTKLGEVAHRVMRFESRLLLLAVHAGFKLPVYDSDVDPEIVAQRLDKR